MSNTSACGLPNCHCVGKNLYLQYQISVLTDGQPKVFPCPASMVEQVRQQIAMRHRLDAAAATICSVNLNRFPKTKENP